MLLYVAFGALILAGLVLTARWFAFASASDLAQAFRTFIAVFTMLASTGLIFMGRFGLAIVTVAAFVMAVRSLLKAKRGADPISDSTGPASQSAVHTELLEMRLDRTTGELDGFVRKGSHAGRTLSSLGVPDLLTLLDAARRDDPPSVALLETYLDRREPDWRGRAGGSRAGGAGVDGRSGAGEAPMDEAMALSILGLAKGATVEEIRAAHRRLMARVHPDRGGSNYLASQINRARDVLLALRGES